jgi:hypothetical protein
LVPGSDALFRLVVRSNRAWADPIEVPEGYETQVREYAAANPQDGEILLRALKRDPRFHRGGWIMKLQPRAGAMTLDTDVFLVRDLTPRRYVHELVHVSQYEQLGAVPFVEQYFASSVREILRRMVRRQPLDLLTASHLENDAYAIERRFVERDRPHP